VSVERAAALILAGKLVAFPTETVYGLGALALDAAAIARIFAMKGRPATHPLIAHVRDAAEAATLTTAWDARAQALAEKFWPGPLTLIVPASEKVPLKVTGNTGRLAVRQSKSTVANYIITALNQPLIATSANISGHPTCRSGIEVFGMMDGRVDLVLDGGACGGVGATTVDITEPIWKVIKEGSIEEKQIAECLHGM